MSIESFRHKGLRRILEDDDARGVPAMQAQKIRRIRFALQEAAAVSDMDVTQAGVCTRSRVIDTAAGA